MSLPVESETIALWTAQLLCEDENVFVPFVLPTRCHQCDIVQAAYVEAKQPYTFLSFIRRPGVFNSPLLITS